MLDYRSTEERFEYSPDLRRVYDDLQRRLKPNRDREMTRTGPECDGKTPFIDVFLSTKEEPYAIRLAKAIVRSWMVTEPVLWDGDYLIGSVRPARPVSEHFSIGIRVERHVLDRPAYAEKRESLNKIIDELMPDFFPLDYEHMEAEARRRFNPPKVPQAYDQYMRPELWTVGGYQGHTVPNYDILLGKGIGGVHRQASERLEEETDERKRTTLEACIIILEGLRDWILMQGEAAEKKAEAETDAVLTQRYRQIAANCRAVAFDPPQTFHQAAQLMWCYNLWDCVDCVGRADQYLYPFFEKALEEDRQYAEDVCASLMLKFLEHGVHNITVGGIRPGDGEDGANDLTFLMLQILRRNHETHPRMSVRIHEKSDPCLLRLTVKMWSEGMSDPTVASDTLIIPAFIENYGVEPRDARNYSLLGCQELEIPGKSNFGCEDGKLNLAKVLEYTLNDGKSRRYDKVRFGLPTGHITDYDTFEELWDAYERQMKYFTGHFVELCNLGQEIRGANYAKLVKTPFTEACIQRGLNLDEGGAVYNYGCVETAGSSVVADSLTAIKKLVFEEKRIAKETLEAALAANFEGYERERLMLLNGAPKFGNDDPEADAMAVRVLESFWKEIKKYKSVRGGEFTGACSLLESGTTYGSRTWATPDGRRAGEPLGNSIGPRPGADKKGLTAMLNSCAKLPLGYGLGGTTCNIQIPTSITRTPEMRRDIEDLIYTYLQNGGQLGQITTACVEELLDAKAHPEAHQDLLIRIGGYSIRFCELNGEDQDEIISRYAGC